MFDAEVLRLLPAVAYLGLAAALVARNGIPTSDDMQIAWVVTGLFVGSIAVGNGRARRVLVDWLPLAVALTAYDMLRGVGGGRVPIHSHEQIWVSEKLFGVVPGVWLQQHLWNPRHLHWWDYATWTVYMSYFVATIAVLAVLWVKRPELFHRYVAMLVALCFTALLFFTLAPTMPPWLTSQKGMIGPITRLIGPIGAHLPPFLDGTPLWNRGVKLGNDLAAFPSLHEGTTVLIGLFFWPYTKRWIRVLLVAYPLAMAWALVYSGEHYVVDLVGGALAAVAVAYAVDRAAVPKRRLATLLAWTSVR